MKKIFTLLCSLSISVTGLLAQATPNAGFENWTTGGFPSHTDPDNWNCANGQTAVTGVITVLKATGAADIHSGAAAAKLVTKQIPSPFNQIVPGMVTTGTINTSTQIIEGGIAYTLRPDSIVGWYKYTPQGGENGFIGFNLFGSAPNNADTVATAGFATPTVTVGTYTRFSAPLVYRSANAVANSIWIAASSNNNALASSIGSTLFIDDLTLVFNPTTSVEEPKQFELTIGPNPATEHITITNSSGSRPTFILYNAMGSKVAEMITENGINTVDLNAFPNGLYFYSILDENNNVIVSSKLIIRK